MAWQILIKETSFQLTIVFTKDIFKVVAELQSRYIPARHLESLRGLGKQIMNADRCWEYYFRAYKFIYLEEDKEKCNRELDSLVDLAIQWKNKEFSEAVVTLGEQLKNVTPKQRIHWRTSWLSRNFYPPIPISIVHSPVVYKVFEQANQLDCHREEYSLRMPLIPEEDFIGIEQHANVSDCSLVVSLINIHRFNKTVPEVKKLDKHLYAMNLYFNGSKDRLVVVSTSDIPTMNADHTKQMSVHSSDITDKVIELGLLKLTSMSYHSEGSNTAIDTYRICGWIPEISRINEFNFTKVVGPFKKGECLLAMGTGGFVPKNNNFGVKLRKYHDYAVLDINTEKEYVVLRDPLVKEQLLTIDFASVKRYFLQVYCNWDGSKLFHKSKDIFMYYSDNKFNPYHTLAGKPSYYIKNDSDREEYAWILLEFHIDSGKNGTAYLQEIPDRVSIVRLGFNDNSAEVGFQLLKLVLKPHERKWYFCYSSVDKMMTFRTFASSKLVTLVRSRMPACDFDCIERPIQPDRIKTLQYPDYSDHDIYFLTSIDFSIEGEPGTTVITDMVVCMETAEDLVGFQMYHWDDLDLTSPIYDEFYLNSRMFEKKDLPLTSGERYHIVASTSKPPTSKNFQCAVSGINVNADYPFGYKLRETDIRYNSMPFKLLHDIILHPNATTKFEIANRNKFNKLFIRIYPQTHEENYRYAYELKRSDTGETLFKVDRVEKRFGGIVIKEFPLNDEIDIELSITLNPNGKAMTDVHTNCYIGSFRKVIIR